MLKPTYSMTHTQTVPAQTWTIKHALNCKPTVSVAVNYQGSLQEILPNSISYPDGATVVIGFTTAYSGVARLS